MTARRMAAELIPKYAPHCPGALQAAVHVLKQLCQSCAVELRKKGESKGSEGAPPKGSSAGAGGLNGEHSQDETSELVVLAGAASSAFSGLAALLSLAATFATSAATGKLSTLPVVVPMRPGVPPTATHYASVARDAASFLLASLQPAVKSEPVTGTGTGTHTGTVTGGVELPPLPVADLERPAKRAKISADEGEQKKAEEAKSNVATAQSPLLSKGSPNVLLFDTLTQQHGPQALPAIVGSAIVSAIAEQPEVLLGVAMEAARGKDTERKKLGQHLILQVTKSRPENSDGEAGSVKEEPDKEKNPVSIVKQQEPSGDNANAGSVKKEEPDVATGGVKKEEGQQKQQNRIETCLAIQVRACQDDARRMLSTGSHC